MVVYGFLSSEGGRVSIANKEAHMDETSIQRNKEKDKIDCADREIWGKQTSSLFPPVFWIMRQCGLDQTILPLFTGMQTVQEIFLKQPFKMSHFQSLGACQDQVIGQVFLEGDNLHILQVKIGDGTV